MSVDAGQRRRQSDATSKAMKRSAAARQCPKCSRKGALKRIRDAAGFVAAVVCRWCDYERGPARS